MHNVTHEVTKDKLVITIDLSKDSVQRAPPSKTGRTNLVASSGGPVAVACPYGEVTFSLNVMAR